MALPCKTGGSLRYLAVLVLKIIVAMLHQALSKKAENAFCLSRNSDIVHDIVKRYRLTLINDV